VTRLTEELKKLTQEKPIRPTEATGTRATPAQSLSVQQQRTVATASAGEGPRPLVTPVRNFQRPLIMQNRPSFPSQPTVCWGCGLPGHIKRNCPSNGPGVLGPSPSYLANRGSKNCQDNSNVYVMMKVLGKEVPCIVDSGCDVTIVPKELTDRCNSLEVRASTRQIWAAKNTPIHIFGETELPLELDGRCLWTPALVSEDVDEVMLGFDWLVGHNCLWDFNTGRLTVDGRETVALGYRG